jgi:hypothetical protein
MVSVFLELAGEERFCKNYLALVTISGDASEFYLARKEIFWTVYNSEWHITGLVGLQSSIYEPWYLAPNRPCKIQLTA